MSVYVNSISPEAQLCAASAGAEFLLPLILLCESRTTLDLRALTNMKGGRLKAHHHESSEYADQLKALDAALTAADSSRAPLMPHGASTYTSVVLDLIQDAQQLFWEQTLPLGGSVSGGGGGTGTSAADIAAAMAAANEASKLESSKECTTTYEQQRHANVTLSSSPSTRLLLERKSMAIAMHCTRPTNTWGLHHRISTRAPSKCTS